jgi:hypothetical protein
MDWFIMNSLMSNHHPSANEAGTPLVPSSISKGSSRTLIAVIQSAIPKTY